MIASVDGTISVDQRSGGLGGPADREMFLALRSVADVILVGGGTVAAEQYRPPDPSADDRRRRRQRGQAEVPAVAVVSARLRLDVTAPLFDGRVRPIVITVADADPAAVEALGPVADVLVAGRGQVDLDDGLAQLRRRGASVVLCEGGPTLAGTMTEHDLLDELCLTVAPWLVGGDGGRMVHNPTAALRGLHLDRVLEQDDYLFLRYLRTR